MSTTHTISDSRKFIYVDSKSVDKKYRINLGAKIFSFYKRISIPDEFEIFINSTGDVLLKPKMKVPAKEKWLYENPISFQKFQQGVKDVIDGKISSIDDMDDFLNDL